jgi:hypothetical protein
MPERGLTRRAFLGAAGVSMAALATGCGGEDKAAADARADGDVMSALLARERAAVERLKGLEKGRGAAEITRARRHDEAHVRRLEAELKRLGGERPAADNGAMAAATPLIGALAVKQDLYARYLDAMGRLRAARLRSLVVSIAVVEAEHIAALRAAAGANPLDNPFPVGERS